MIFLTYKQIRDKIQNDLDLLDENFITKDELLGYINEAIDDVEAQIHTLSPSYGDDYFLVRGSLSVVAGTPEYALPGNIYSNKIRKLLFINGSIRYEVRRIRDLKDVMFVQNADEYTYKLVNTEDVGPRIRLYPEPRETIDYEIWYLRNAKRLTTSLTDVNNVCDVPEFVNYVIQHAKTRCYEKEMHPNAVKAIEDEKRLRDLMLETLSTMVPDEDTKIPMDFDFYREFDYDAWFNY